MFEPSDFSELLGAEWLKDAELVAGSAGLDAGPDTSRQDPRSVETLAYAVNTSQQNASKRTSPLCTAPGGSLMAS